MADTYLGEQEHEWDGSEQLVETAGRRCLCLSCNGSLSRSMCSSPKASEQGTMKTESKLVQ